MQIRDRIENATGQPPSWWALELYKVAFVLVGGILIGWVAGASKTAQQPPNVFGETVAAAPPEWLGWFLIPGMIYFLWTVFPWPGKGPGLSM